MTALATTSLIVGAAISTWNAPGMLAPDKFAVWLRALPRDRKIGMLLMAINAIWTGIIVFTGQYGDFWKFPEQMIRSSVFVLAPLFFFAVIKYADQYLAARGEILIGILDHREKEERCEDEHRTANHLLWKFPEIAVLAGEDDDPCPDRVDRHQ